MQTLATAIDRRVTCAFRRWRHVGVPRCRRAVPALWGLTAAASVPIRPPVRHRVGDAQGAPSQDIVDEVRCRLFRPTLVYVRMPRVLLSARYPHEAVRCAAVCRHTATGLKHRCSTLVLLHTSRYRRPHSASRISSLNHVLPPTSYPH